MTTIVVYGPGVTVEVIDRVVAPPPAGSAGAWTKFPCAWNNDPALNTEAEYQSWYNLTYDTKRDVFYGVDWGGIISAFSPTLQRWTKLCAPTGGGIHNRTLTYDPINDRVWLANGTGSQLMGTNYFDLTTNAWVNHPMTLNLPGAEAAMIFDAAGRQFITFGGWQLYGVRTFALDPVGTTLGNPGVTGGPVWSANDATKMTHWRSDLDTKRNRIVYVDTDGSLWALALPLAPNSWQRLTTTGTMPPKYTQFVYDPDTDCLVGWSAANAVAGGSPYILPERETWILPFATMAWEKAASAADGVLVPGRTVYVAYALDYDPIRKQTILHTLSETSNYSPSTWAYRRAP